MYLQVIISGLSSSAVLTDSGALNYARAIGLYVHYICHEVHALILSSHLQLERVSWTPSRRAAIR